jgi:hypothetical protein
MTEEQLNALEDWVVAIIRREDRASDAGDNIYWRQMREAVEVAFEIREKNDD